MESTVHNFRFLGLNIVESNGCIDGVLLRAPVHLNIVHDELTNSLNDFLVHIEFLSVRSDDLASPSIGLSSLNQNVSCEENDLTSHVDTVVVVSGGIGLTPMVEFECLLHGDHSSQFVIRLDG